MKKTSKTHIIPPMATAIALALLSGCATSSKSTAPAALSAPTTQKPVVAVLPFDNSKQYEEKTFSGPPKNTKYLAVAKPVPGEPNKVYSPYTWYLTGPATSTSSYHHLSPTDPQLKIDISGYEKNEPILDPRFANVPYTSYYFLAPGSTPGAPVPPSGVKRFERTYFAARLLMPLRFDKSLGGAFFTDAATPAADYTVESSVKKSDGKMTVVNVKLMSADGRKLWSKTFSVNTKSSQYSNLKADPAARIWLEIAQAISKTPQRPGQFAISRTTGYAGQKNLTVTDSQASKAEQAAAVERERILAPVTDKLLTYANAPGIYDRYRNWQAQSTPQIEARSAEKTSQNIQGAFALIGMLGGAAGGYYGNTSLISQSSNLVTTATTNIQISGKHISSINETLAQYSKNFDSYNGGSLTVTLFGKVYTLKGTLAQQQADFRKLVAAELLRTPTSEPILAPMATASR